MPDLHPTGESPIGDAEFSEPSIRVEVTNETDADVDARRIEEAVRLALADASYDQASVSVAIVDDETIHRLNRQFLEHDYPTDVLSFPLEDDPPRLEGEIVVSIDTARRCAVEAGWAGDEELLLYVIHGALHLAGYCDKDVVDAAEMRAAECAVLAKLGVAVSARDSRWRDAYEEGESP
jgi:probable rRNA maturation factor